MSIDTKVYVGPYAEVKVRLVTEGKKVTEEPSVDWYDMTDGAIAPAHQNQTPPDEDGFRRYRFFPNVARPGEPEREMHLAEPWVEMWEDWSHLDIPGEIAWFTKAFALEIDLLKDTYGGVAIKWGALQWCG